MKILQISKFYAPVAGGIESTVRCLTEGLNGQPGWRADVLCANTLARTLQEQWDGYAVIRAASLGTLLSTSMSPMLVAWARRLCPAYDVVHVHMPDPMAALALWMARPRARLVVHWHSDVVRQRFSRRLYEPLQHWLLARADAIVATSQAYAEASAPLAPWRAKLAVVPIGIHDNWGTVTPAQVAAIRQRHGGRKIVFALGRMTYYKGFEVLIEAAAALPDDCVVLIGGGGEGLVPLREQVAQRGLTNKVHLPGPIADDELAAHHAAAEVFCLPSTARSEAFGVAMLEAMRAGRPVVATDIPGSGVPWVNQDGVTGLNVPVGSASALADALHRIITAPETGARMGAAARHRFTTTFTASEMTSRTMNLYRRLAPP